MPFPCQRLVSKRKVVKRQRKMFLRRRTGCSGTLGIPNATGDLLRKGSSLWELARKWVEAVLLGSELVRKHSTTLSQLTTAINHNGPSLSQLETERTLGCEVCNFCNSGAAQLRSAIFNIPICGSLHPRTQDRSSWTSQVSSNVLSSRWEPVTSASVNSSNVAKKAS